MSRPAPSLQRSRARRVRDVERIERIAAGDESQPRTGRAVAEGPADTLARERRAGEHVGGKIGIRQHHAAEADEVGVRPWRTLYCATFGSHSCR